MKWQNMIAGLLRALIALCVALILGGIVIAIAQKDISAPIKAYQALFVGAVGSPLAWSNTLSRTMPLLLTGVGVSVALAAGLFNIGAEGQLAVGGLAAAVVGFTAKGMPGPLVLLFAPASVWSSRSRMGISACLSQGEARGA